MDFAPLNIVTGYTYLESGITAGRAAKEARKRGYPGIGIQDIDTLAGIAPFESEARGMGLGSALGTRFSPLPSLALYIKEEKGYRNLLRLDTLRELGLLKEEDFFTHAEGLLAVLVPSPGTAFEQRVLEKAAKAFHDLWIGLPLLPKEEMDSWRDFAKDRGIPVAAFPEVRYWRKEDHVSLLMLHAIKEQEKLSIKEAEGNLFFPTPESLQKSYLPEEIKESVAILRKCMGFRYVVERGTPLLYPEAKEEGAAPYLRRVAEEGLRRKGKLEKPGYRERLDYELRTIEKTGFSDYMLIVQEYVDEARRRGILVGPGRGSAPGSIVAYALGITMPDPLEHGLLFERFLNPERKSMPDIDVDFEDVRRDELFLHLEERYGKERTARILAVQTIKAKKALDDVGRIYSYPESDISLLKGKILDDDRSLRDDYRLDKDFRSLVDSDPYYLEIVSLASKIEGLPRQEGLHAPGALLNETPLGEALPLHERDGTRVALLDKDHLEPQGFLKMDLLPLTNLSTIRLVLEDVREKEGKELSYEDIPYDDEEAIALIRRGETMGLFQLESPGMKRAIEEVRPTSFGDIAAIEALFRPGPMGQIPLYARRKNGKEETSYPLEALRPILEETYGIIVYQEQVMEICRKAAGMSYGESDLFRRAIAKKDAEKLHALRPRFLEGMRRKGHTEKEAEDLYSLIERFADYGFNKSHAVSYAMLTCQMAYLKARFPRSFYAAILQGMGPGERKFRDVLSEMRRRGMRLLLPDVNRSGFRFEAEEGGIRAPLSFVKEIPGNLVRGILEEREENGPYKDLFDFAARARKKGLQLKHLVRLMDGGALDCFHETRATLRASAPRAMDYARMLVGDDGSALLVDFDAPKPSLRKAEEDPRVALEAEKEALGIMLSGSPLAHLSETIRKSGAIPLSDIPESGSFLTVGLVKAVRARLTKSGKKMAYLEVQDEAGEESFTLWEECYREAYPLLKADRPLLLKGHVNMYKGRRSLVLDEARPLLEE